MTRTDASPVPISWIEWPAYDQAHFDAVAEVIRSNRLFNGPKLNEFEAKFSEFTGSAFTVGLGNATQGLHLALAATDIGVDHEVIVTPYSWISSASCVLMQNAIPVFADIEPRTFGLDLQSIKEKVTSKTKAVILVHMFGYPADVEQIADFCRSKDIILVEDCSHAFGLRINGQHVGLFGDVGVFSMQQRKPISTGDGCAAITKHRSVAEKMARLRSFGDSDLSYNYRMSEFSSALGLVGLQRIQNHNVKRRQNVEMFCNALSDTCPLRPVVYQSSDAEAVYYSLLLDTEQIPRDEVDSKLRAVNALGVPIKRTWTPLNLHDHFNPISPPARGLPWMPPFNSTGKAAPAFKDLELPVSEEYQLGRLLELELHPLLTSAQVESAACIIGHIFGCDGK